MKIGLCIIDVPASVGGGFVFRDSVAQAAVASKGRHAIELIKARPVSREFQNPNWAERRARDASGDPLPTLGRKGLLRLGLQGVVNPGAAKEEIRRRLENVIQDRVEAELHAARLSLKDYVDWAVEQQLNWPNPDKFRVFDDAAAARNCDMLWFNNIEPIHNGVPYIFNIFDLQHRLQPFFPEVSGQGQFRHREGAYAESLQRAAYVITASEETREQVAHFYGVPLERIRVIPFPTPQAALEAPANAGVTEAELRAKHGVTRPYLFYPAQFWPHKNHISLLYALRLLVHEHGLDLSLVLTGADHGNAGYVRDTAAALGLADRVHLIGFVPHDELVPLYRHAAALSYMTYFGPDNLPPLEAFALGCPVVMSHIPGVEKLYEDAAIYVSLKDERDIADGIRRVFDDPDATRRRVEKGRKIAERNTVSNYVERVQDLFDEFAATRRCWPGSAAPLAAKTPGRMRVMILSTDYGPFLKNLYEGDPTLREAPYAEQLRRRNATLFAGSDFYSTNFIKQGCDAWEFHVNNGPLQTQWLREHGQSVGARPSHPSPLRSPIEPSDLDLEEIIVRQVQAMQPDIILNQAVSEVESRVLERLRPYTKLIVGQIASPFPEEETYSAYDMMVSSLPNFVRYYRERGLPAELNLLGFDPSVLEHVKPGERDVPLSFVGSITSDHGARYKLIERLARETDIKIWGRLVNVPEDSPIAKRFQSEAWGAEMFRVLGRTKITVNQHIDIAENYANNMRLFEATGMGALLITDKKDNIADLYEPGTEVVCYDGADECIALIKYYLEHEDERAAIAAAGQRRTLRDHTYAQVVAEQVRIFSRALAAKGASV
ncbi:MAG: glycosyltransferase [Hyphomonadaceae bacterium]|nr:glycosyltransferase [Hyphomonadaceae bacterium]